MSENCAGRHVCEPDTWPTDLGQRWTCPGCGAEHHAFDVHEQYAEVGFMARSLERIPLGTLGWSTIPARPADRSTGTEGAS